VRIRAVGASAAPGREGRLRLEADVAYQRGAPARETYWFEVPEPAGAPAAERGDAWLAALLPLAVTLGEPLRVDLPVDAKLRRGACELMEIWASWYPPLRPVPIEVDVDEAPASANRGIGAFFSGGVDSTFTAIRRREDGLDPAGCPDDLISVHGFDIPLPADAAFRRFRGVAAGTAAQLGLRFYDVGTNLRATRLGEAPWGPLAHGCALAAVALVLQSLHRAVLVAATGGYRDLHPWGSHPLTDPLLSTSATTIVHDGAGFTRVGKLRHVVASAALPGLRVCWESKSDLNCGNCMKCLQTMIALELLGALGRADSFPMSLDTRRVRRLDCRHAWDFRELNDLRLLAVECGRRDLVRALDHAMRRSRLRGGVTALRRSAEGLLPRPRSAPQ
jgi:hypothetical protein